MNVKGVMNWLLEENQPSLRYLALTQLLGRPQSDGEVQSAKQKIPEKGWAAEILAQQKAGGWWAEDESLYRPKYISTNWMLLILSDLGLTRQDRRIADACELWIKRFAKKDGGFGIDNDRRSELCVVGNTARALVRFGYADHPRVSSAFQWLVKNQSKLGGWSCFGSGRNLDSWEGLSAFAVYPKEKWTRSMKHSVEMGAEFYLERELHRQGAHYRPWYRFHYPAHYFYDLLVGLEFMTALGYGDDKRLDYALSLLKKKRRRDGKWILEAVHPDVEGGVTKYYEKIKPIPVSLEKSGESSKVITLKAMTILHRVENLR